MVDDDGGQLAVGLLITIFSQQQSICYFVNQCLRLNPTHSFCHHITDLRAAQAKTCSLHDYFQSPVGLFPCIYVHSLEDYKISSLPPPSSTVRSTTCTYTSSAEANGHDLSKHKQSHFSFEVTLRLVIRDYKIHHTLLLTFLWVSIERMQSSEGRCTLTGELERTE